MWETDAWKYKPGVTNAVDPDTEQIYTNIWSLSWQWVTMLSARFSNSTSFYSCLFTPYGKFKYFFLGKQPQEQQPPVARYFSIKLPF